MTLERLRTYVDRNRGRNPITEAFPFDDLMAFDRSGAPLPAEALAILVPLLELAHRFDDAGDGYEGDDLKRQAVVIGALALCPHDLAVEQRLASLLASTTFERAFAAPGSPDADKYERDVAVEGAQDMLALAAVNALARHPRTPETLAVIVKARKHRDPDVRAITRWITT